LSCHDGLYVTGWPPLISISPENATRIIEALGSGESLTVTMYSDILKLPELAGTGYNPVGYLPGKYYGTTKDEFVIFGPHHDAWFQGAMDDTSGMAALLVVAKAMREVMDETGWVPDRTVIFTSHTAEEYGLDNTYYDWCWGAYYQINVEHADDWIGRTVGYLCMELMGMAGEPVYINCVPELYTYTRDVLAANVENMPYGFTVDNNAHTWADHWTFSAAGVPGLEFETTSEEWEEYYYHTQCDAPEIIDYSYLEQCFAVISDLTVGMVTSTFAPYDFETLATDLSSHLLHEEELWGVSALDEIYAYFGMSTENRDRLLSEAARFQEDSAALKAALASVNPAKAHEVNTELMSIVGTLDTALIAIGVWEQDWYPYQQPINDVYHLWWALEKLWAKMDGTGDDMGLGTLNWVGMTWYYAYSSYGNYMDQRDRLTGDRVASWGLQTHLQPAVDIWWEYDALMSVKGSDGPTFEDVLWVVPSLEGVLGGTALAQLEDAFVLMWTALEDANGQVEDLVEDISKGS
ncbi:MAG: M28 family metallopeptidase, partial [Thermoplasmata archaeon]